MSLQILVVAYVAALALTAPLARPPNFESDPMLAVGSRDTSSYATVGEGRSTFKADTMLAVVAKGDSSYATQRRAIFKADPMQAVGSGVASSYAT